ncbi:unnamed protein product [Brachionus calyciflorus]|uniref:Uncharacterized protein n=1 Tax=Brachionus calyciflorus TaxID=104777 RepID=A0A814NJF0_9BILA|nr:unnamed protein product [Brachionus calyciflorus]
MCSNKSRNMIPSFADLIDGLFKPENISSINHESPKETILSTLKPLQTELSNLIFTSSRQPIQTTVTAPMLNDPSLEGEWSEIFYQSAISCFPRLFLFIIICLLLIICIVLCLKHCFLSKTLAKENTKMIEMRQMPRSRSRYYSIGSSIDKYKPYLFGTFKPENTNIPRSFSNGSYFKVQDA